MVPSIVVGRNLSDALLAEGVEWINLRFETMSSIARSVAAPHLAEKGLELLSRAESLGLVEQACLDVLDERSYFHRLRDHPGFHQAVGRTIADLRKAGATPGLIRRGKFEDSRKKREIEAILARYEELLESRKLIDVAGMFAVAIEQAAGARARYRESRWATCEPLERFEPRERELLELITENRPVALQAEEVAPAEPAMIFAADGIENEIREIVRRFGEDRTRWDRVEIASVDPGTVETTLFEMLAQLGVEATWERGISIRFTRPGRALLGFLEWIREDCDAVLLRRLLASGVLKTGSLSPALAARLLRDASVGWGRERYVKRMDALVKERIRKIGDDEKRVPQIEKAREMERLIRSLIRLVPGDAARESFSVGEMAELAITFNQEWSFVGSDLDGNAFAAIDRVLRDISSLDRIRGVPLRETVDRLAGIISEIRVGASSARAGAVHVASVRGAGWAGRDWLFIPGLTSSSFPGGEGQDPIILDHERQRLNRHLDGSLEMPGGSARRREEDLKRLLARRPRRLDISYSVSQTVSPSKEAPSAIVLDLYRESQPGSGFEQMRSAIEASLVSCLPGDSGLPVTTTEEWLAVWRRRGGAGADWRSLVASTEPALEAGIHAISMRNSPSPNVFNGFLEGDLAELDPTRTGELVSASRLEVLARCPYSYFLQYVLRVRPLEEIVRDPEIWLDAREYGKLIHAVFHDLMGDPRIRNLIDASFDEAIGEARALADHRLAVLRDALPPPTESAYRARREQVYKACEILLLEESAAKRVGEPYAFEVSFGRAGEETSGLGSPEPVEIDLDGSTLRLRGQIDRIDRLPDGGWEVIDYKSGSPRPYTDGNWLGGGKRLQHALYARATEQLLGRAGLGGRVEQTGYYFPTAKGQGRRVSWRVQDADPGMAGLNRTLGLLIEAVRRGSFPHSPLQEDCRYCDFREACGALFEGKGLPGDLGRAPGARAWSESRGLAPESASDGPSPA